MKLLKENKNYQYILKNLDQLHCHFRLIHASYDVGADFKFSDECIGDIDGNDFEKIDGLLYELEQRVKKAGEEPYIETAQGY